MLIGALGLGAQGLYSLDVTTVPAATAAVSTFADALSHWQFIDRDETVTTGNGAAAATRVIKGDPDLGYIFGRPAIVRVRGALVGRTDPTWVAIIGNGYNSTEDDGSRNAGCDDTTPDVDESDASACGQAVPMSSRSRPERWSRSFRPVSDAMMTPCTSPMSATDVRMPWVRPPSSPTHCTRMATRSPTSLMLQTCLVMSTAST